MREEPTQYTISAAPQLSITEYHSLPGVSSSRLKVFIEDPREYWYQYLSGQYVKKKEDKFDFGSAVHDIVVAGPAAKVKIIPPDVLSSNGAKSTNAWRDYEADHADWILLKSAEYEAVMRCVDAMSDDVDAGPLMAADGEREQTFAAYDEDLGLELRCRPDKLFLLNGIHAVIDYKTDEQGTQAGRFARTIGNFGYHLQEYFYRRVMLMLGIEVGPFIFIAVQKKLPHCVDCYTLSAKYLRLGETVVENALVELAERTRANDWRRRGSGSIVELKPPGYLDYAGDYAIE